MTPAMVRHRIRPGGPWQRLLPGVYLTVTGTPTTAQEEIGALLYAGKHSLITGLVALRHYGLHVPGRKGITVLVPAGHTRPSRAFVRMTTTTRMPERFCADGRIRFVMPGRAVADATRELKSLREVRAVVANAVQQDRCRLDWLADELAHGPVRGSAWLRRALAEVADGIRSVAEGDLRDLIVAAGLPMPLFNASLYAEANLLAVADAWWPEAGVVVEVDSREWHLSPADWERTLRRHAAMSARGIIVLHFTPRQIREEPARVVAEIRAALAAGRRRDPLAIRATPAAG
ncbi:MAG: hypothetical protein J2P32_14565 [Actinobacteria bacterium]|nr:hypothetical protein [Actinomycetota bacterium]